MTTSHNSLYEPEWRSKQLADRLAFAYCNRLFTDITICLRLGNQEHRFTAHKNILANYSSVLEKRFYRNDDVQDVSCIEVIGMDPRGLAYVLRLLYNVIPTSGDEITDRCTLLSAYHVAVMLGFTQTERQLKREILDLVLTPSLVARDDFWKILDLSRVLKLKGITRRLLKFAESHGEEVLRSESVAKASPNTVKQVLELDNLKASERDVLDAIVRWKEGNEKLPFSESFARDLLGCVRFRNLSLLDLSQFVSVKSDSISKEDVLKIMMHLGNPALKPLPAWCSNKFRRPDKSLTKDSNAAYQDEGDRETSDNNKESAPRIVQYSSLLSMYFKQKNTDVLFLVGSMKIPIKAHRNVLALGSMVFEKMFFGPLPDPRYRIEVPYLNPAGFEKMIMYFYDDSDPDCLFRKPEIASEAFDAALKYGSVRLKDVCLNYFTLDKPSFLKTFWERLESMSKRPADIDNSSEKFLDYAPRKVTETSYS